MAAELSALHHQCTRKRTYADRAEAKQAQRAMHGGYAIVPCAAIEAMRELL